jgi:hypothetical protein
VRRRQLAAPRSSRGRFAAGAVRPLALAPLAVAATAGLPLFPLARLPFPLRPAASSAVATGKRLDQLVAAQHPVALDAGLGGEAVQLGKMLGLQLGFGHSIKVCASLAARNDRYGRLLAPRSWRQATQPATARCLSPSQARGEEPDHADHRGDYAPAELDHGSLHLVEAGVHFRPQRPKLGIDVRAKASGFGVDVGAQATQILVQSVEAV